MATVVQYIDLHQGLDLARLAGKQQFAFVDGLSDLFSSPQANPAPSASSNVGVASRATLPLRSQHGVVPGRVPPPSTSAETGGNVRRGQTGQEIAKKLRFSGRGTAALDALERDITEVIQQCRKESDELLLILDQPDFLLAATGPTMGIGATEVAEWVTGLQQVRSSGQRDIVQS